MFGVCLIPKPESSDLSCGLEFDEAVGLFYRSKFELGSLPISVGRNRHAPACRYHRTSWRTGWQIDELHRKERAGGLPAPLDRHQHDLYRASGFPEATTWRSHRASGIRAERGNYPPDGADRQFGWAQVPVHPAWAQPLTSRAIADCQIVRHRGVARGSIEADSRVYRS